MGIGEVGSINNTSYMGQGSSVITAPQTSPVQSVSTEDNSTKKNAVPEDVIAAYQSTADVNKNNSNNEEEGLGASSSLKEAVEKINSKNGNYEAVFGIHEGTNRVMIKMVEKESRKTIKEFPAEATLDLIAKAWELAGIMVDEKR